MVTISVENDHHQMVYSLSNLPDALLITILSLLPTCIAARTSVLCRRFRHLWEASPSLNFTIRDIPEPKSDNFIAMVDRTLLRRNPSYALHGLHLNLHEYGSFRLTKHAFFVSSLFAKASALRVRHLTVRGCMYLNSHIIPIIFSTDSLRSLSVDSLLNPFEEFYVPYENTLDCLKFLEIGVSYIDPIEFERFISKLSSLEELRLKVHTMYEHELRISSKTITKLELMFNDTQDIDNVTLSLPSLDCLELHYCGSSRECLPHFHGETPLLRRAVLSLSNLHSRDACSVTGLLNCMSHAEELSLRMREDTVIYNFS